jgi:hypothetical protein
MYLPHREKANVSREKIVNYLLSFSHPIGKHKATFFTNVGFEVAKPDVLIEALKELAKETAVTKTVRTNFGTKYVLDGYIWTPNKREYPLRTVWIIENKAEVAYLVTAYPI